MTSSDKGKAPSRVYSYYVLSLLMVIYAFNFLDRQIITILAPSLKEDLGLTDAQLGLLFGTAFALFYALFGIPLAKLADGWNRVKTISLALTVWSGMTAVSGFSANFAQLGAARVGVGIGEAAAGPAAYSLVQDYFPKKERATAIAFYSSGIYIGVGASLIFGGLVIDYWALNYTAETQPFGLAGWQATFLAFGIPGLVLALLMRLTVREPVRGFYDEVKGEDDPHPFRSVWKQMSAMFPPMSMIGLARIAKDKKPFLLNISVAILAILAAYAMIAWTDGLLPAEKKMPITTIGSIQITTNFVQWAAMAIAIYCSFSWMQSIRRSDAPTASLIANKNFAMLSLVGGMASFASYGLSPFIFLYAAQEFGVGPNAGITLGAILAVSGGLGTIAGGMISDKMKMIHPSGRLYFVIAALCFAAIATYFQLTTSSLTVYYTLLGASNFFLIMWLAPVGATCQDLVIPRMRGTATAVFFLGTNIIGLGLGPFVVGLVSDVTGSLQTAMLTVLAVYPVAIILLLTVGRALPEMEATVTDRARAAGEAI